MSELVQCQKCSKVIQDGEIRVCWGVHSEVHLCMDCLARILTRFLKQRGILPPQTPDEALSLKIQKPGALH